MLTPISLLLPSRTSPAPSPPQADSVLTSKAAATQLMRTIACAPIVLGSFCECDNRADSPRLNVHVVFDFMSACALVPLASLPKANVGPVGWRASLFGRFGSGSTVISGLLRSLPAVAMQDSGLFYLAFTSCHMLQKHRSCYAQTMV